MAYKGRRACLQMHPNPYLVCGMPGPEIEHTAEPYEEYANYTRQLAAHQEVMARQRAAAAEKKEHDRLLREAGIEPARSRLSHMF